MALTADPPFMGAQPATSPDGFEAAIFGAPHGTPYQGIDNRVHATAPDAFRAALADDREWLAHWDFDLGGPLLGDGLKLPTSAISRPRRRTDQEPPPHPGHDAPTFSMRGRSHHVRRR